jgi:16S rRNA (cytosine967-C5)-methyltransferase
MAEQQAVLARAATLVRPGGEIAYITCSVLADENGGQVAAFLEANPAFAIVPPAEVLELAPDALAERHDLIAPDGLGLQLTPHRTATDGFFIARMRRKP